MNFYEKELDALKRSGRFREREVYSEEIIDLASNDYLSLAHHKNLSQNAFKILSNYEAQAPKASMLVNGYHQIHADFEKALCEANGFESGIVVGSGFSANIAMIESLVRRGDALFMDEKYHASGVLATALIDVEVIYFKHNDASDLHFKMLQRSAKRKIIAVEGIYSMDGDVLNKEIIEIADEFEAILILDEAHSSGVIGPHLMGVLDYYNIPIKPHYIKMGTLGKAYGSFGGYILASEHIISYLLNRAKPIIYATAPSLYETARSHQALIHIQTHANRLHQEVLKKQDLIKEELGLSIGGLIAPVVVGDNRKVMLIKETLISENILVGAIRQPTVEKAIIRLIARLGVENETIAKACKVIATFG